MHSEICNNILIYFSYISSICLLCRCVVLSRSSLAISLVVRPTQFRLPFSTKTAVKLHSDSSDASYDARHARQRPRDGTTIAYAGSAASRDFPLAPPSERSDERSATTTAGEAPVRLARVLRARIERRRRAVAAGNRNRARRRTRRASGRAAASLSYQSEQGDCAEGRWGGRGIVEEVGRGGTRFGTRAIREVAASDGECDDTEAR